ncbi:MAG TPA: MoxR family ATPase [Thermoanaerobaculia bacterium]|jgi:MoxR-like ATPase|nr:MoxR family ATPase [Thermoanaerobaculia bacterium]
MKKKKDDDPGYTPMIPLRDVEDFRTALDRNVIGDRRDGKIYRYTDYIKLHVNVALATGRPLLLLGPTGCGKSSLAFNLARVMKRQYYELVVTSRSEARDLFYRFDAVRRLGDVHATGTPAGGDATWDTYYPYIDPGPLWWIFNRASAKRRGYPDEKTLPFDEARDPAVFTPPIEKEKDEDQVPAVLLIDELDKAEPDFPNNLLVPLGSQQFTIEELGQPIQLKRPAGDEAVSAPLVVITSNRERELPVAFVRRCVVLELPAPSVDELVEVGKVVTSADREADLRSIATKIEVLRGPERLSIAEFLDAVRAIDRLTAHDDALANIIRSTTWRAEDSEE